VGERHLQSSETGLFWEYHMEEGKHGSMRLKTMNAPLPIIEKTGAKGRVTKTSPPLARCAGDTEMFCREIHNRADTITPLLRQILDFCPTSNWRANK
jgi:hypothetical protein